MCPRCHSRYVTTDVSGRRHWCSTCNLAWTQGEYNEAYALQRVIDEVVKPALDAHFDQLLEDDMKKAHMEASHHPTIDVRDYDKDDE